ncbi:hypothetical protein CC80DRAFT_406147 [Byssothecium circinans]|uniref:DUF6594 domain-containing protein n=1 Tax=Byssothecium circinans TaxID=147558 RepID=A0A6A5U5L4_9PLEO|nr:hypothetical protein CC80DRAFT_406147 [Byssothecium circinans]
MRKQNSGCLPAQIFNQDEIEKPWKYIGYRGFSAFLSLDEDFLIFGRFGTLNTRVLLHLQDQMSILETELNEIDRKHSQKNAVDIHNESFRQERDPRRTELLFAIHTLLKQYNKLLIQHSDLCSRGPALKKDVQSLENWLRNTQNAILDEEQAYVKHTHDLVPLVPKVRTPLRRLLERSSRFRVWRWWMKEPPNDPNIIYPYPETLHYTSDKRIDICIGITITALGMVMLILPLWVLAVTHGTMARIGVITGFIASFLALVAFTTVARPFESLAATAA